MSRTKITRLEYLVRLPDTLELWGIPYRLRPRDGLSRGQEPRDLLSGGRSPRSLGWVYLGSPGWWGHMSKEYQEAAKDFLATIPPGWVPENPWEWVDLAEVPL